MKSKETNKTENVQVQYVALSKIKPSNFNPRKTFKDAELIELAESIKEQGVLQPIMVRTVGTEYEIVYGERRYRASLLAGLKIMPVLVKNLTDDVALEYAITENLQRTNVSPIEEAAAFKYLLDSKRYDISQLVVRFGKSESYIRGRMRLNNLVSEFTTLLENEIINLVTAVELSKFSPEVQVEIYGEHFENADDYNSWCKLKTKDILSCIERSYTTDLDRYMFDKTDCATCIYNTNNQNLFAVADGCGNCSQKTCLKEKNIAFFVEKIRKITQKKPSLDFCHDKYNYDAEVVEKLKEQGYAFTVQEYTRNYPIEPLIPKADEYEKDDEYRAAYDEYEKDTTKYVTEVEKINKLYADGKVTMYAKIEYTDIFLCYVNKELSNDTQLTPLDKLEKQDKRNKELSNEKIIDETKRLYNDAELTGDFTALEDRLIYFGMLSFAKKEHFKQLGIIKDRWHLIDDDKMEIINSLTDEKKNIIRRDFIVTHLKEAFRDGATEELLLEFTRQHLPGQLSEIEIKHNNEYNKRYERIKEKRKAIQSMVEGDELK